MILCSSPALKIEMSGIIGNEERIQWEIKKCSEKIWNKKIEKNAKFNIWKKGDFLKVYFSMLGKEDIFLNFDIF
jgi:hypothetical protein